MDDRTYDLFITHAWRYHDDWTRLSGLLDQALGSSWRNFSVPWYDPALDPNTEVGRTRIHRWLEQQIAPTHGVILLGSVWEQKSARKWLTLEAELARKYQKRVIGLPAFGTDRLPEEAAALTDVQCPWDPAAIIAAVDATETPAAVLP